MTQHFTRKLFSLALFTLTISSHTANAITYSVDGFVGTEAETNANPNNINNNPNNNRAEISQDLGININASQNSRRFDLSSQYNFLYENFSRDTNEDNFSTTGNTSLRFTPIQDRLVWTLNHLTDRVVIGSNTINTVNNRSDRNQLGSSLNYYHPLTAKLFFISSVTAQTVDVQPAENATTTTSFDTDALSTNASVRYTLSPLTYAFLGYQESTTQRDGSNFDITSKRFYTGFERELKQLSYSAYAGNNKLELSETRESDNLYYQLDLAWETSAQRLAINSTQEESSSAIPSQTVEFNDSPLNTGNTQLGSIDTDSATRINTTSISYNNNQLCARCQIQIRSSFNKTRYLSSQNNNASNRNTESTLNNSANLTYQLNRTSALSLTVSNRKTNFKGQTGSITEDRVSARYTQSAFERFNLTLQAFWTDYQTPFEENRDYENLSASAQLSYRFFDKPR